MMLEAAKPLWLRLARSQLTAAVLGLAIAHGIWWHIEAGMQAVLDATTRLPLVHATELAFRFGPAEHARALLHDLAHTPGDDDLGPLDDMVTELRLGALDGEQNTTGQATPHFELARQACLRARVKGVDENTRCSPAKLREIMVMEAGERLVSP